MPTCIRCQIFDVPSPLETCTHCAHAEEIAELKGQIADLKEEYENFKKEAKEYSQSCVQAIMLTNQSRDRLVKELEAVTANCETYQKAAFDLRAQNKELEAECAKYDAACREQHTSIVDKVNQLDIMKQKIRNMLRSEEGLSRAGLRKIIGDE